MITRRKITVTTTSSYVVMFQRSQKYFPRAILLTFYTFLRAIIFRISISTHGSMKIIKFSRVHFYLLAFDPVGRPKTQLTTTAQLVPQSIYAFEIIIFPHFSPEFSTNFCRCAASERAFPLSWIRAMFRVKSHQLIIRVDRLSTQQQSLTIISSSSDVDFFHQLALYAHRTYTLERRAKNNEEEGKKK